MAQFQRLGQRARAQHGWFKSNLAPMARSAELCVVVKFVDVPDRVLAPYPVSGRASVTLPSDRTPLKTWG